MPENLTVKVPKKYGNMELYRVDLVFVVNNVDDPVPSIMPTQFMLIRKRKDGKIEKLVPIQ